MRVFAPAALSLLAHSSVGTATARPAGDDIRAYLADLAPRMREYRAAAARADAAFTEAPDDINRSARAVRASGAEFARLASRCARIRPPRSLRDAHARLVESLRLVSSAFGIYARAWTAYARTSDTAVLETAQTSAASKLERADALRREWVRELKREVRRAGVAHPRWLRTMP